MLGHYDLFHDFMIDCRETKGRYRHDQVQGRWVEYRGQRIFVCADSAGSEGIEETLQKALKYFNVRGKNAEDLRWDGPLVSLATLKDTSAALAPAAKQLARSPSRESST